MGHLMTPYFIALLVAGFISAVTWPGFMSWDSLHALIEARFGVTGGDYPTMVSYIWRPLDYLYPGPSLMLFFQNGLFLLSFAHLLRLLRFSNRSATLCLVSTAFLPPILGTMLVVWKDTLMLAFFLMAIACLLQSELGGGRRSLWLSEIGLLFATACRFNAVAAAIPLWLWLAWRIWPERKGRAFALRSALLIVATLTPIYLLQRFQIPSFHRMPPPSPNGVLLFDVIGTSHFSRRNLLPPAAFHRDPTFSISDLDQLYQPQNLHIAFSSFPLVDDRMTKRLDLDAAPRSDVFSAWRQAIRRYPLAYLKHRFAVTRELISLGTVGVYYPTDYGIPPNSLGIHFKPSLSGVAMVRLVRRASRTALGRPFLYYLAGLLALVLILKKRIFQWHIPALLLSSGLIYIATFLPVAPCADLRYNLYSVVMMIVGILIAGKFWLAGEDYLLDSP